MQPEQKEDKILSYLTYSFLGVIMIILTVLMYRESRPDNVVQYEEPFEIPAVNILTAEELDIERQNFIPTIGTLSEDEIINNSEVKPLSTEEIAKLNAEFQTSNTNVNSNNNNNSTNIKPVTTLNSNPLSSSRLVSFIKEDTFKINEEDKILKNISGLIYDKDDSAQVLVINNGGGSGLIMVKVTANTKVLINSKNSTLAGLGVGDSVSIEGFGKEGSSAIVASSIILTGYTQIIPTN